MKKIIFGFVIAFMMVGCGKYVEPKISNENVAFFSLQEDIPFDNGYGLETDIFLDGKSISSIKKTRINSGKHVLSMEITAFYNMQAKYAEIKSIPINIVNNHSYIVKLKSDKKYFDNVSGDTSLNIIIEDNKKMIIKKRIILKNNRAKTIEKYPDLQSQINTIVTAVILGV